MNQNLHYIKRKNFILYLLVNIVTFGLFNYFVSYQFANELSNENPERKTIYPIGLMFITIIPIVGPIIWISQITSRMKYTVQKYALPINLKTGLIKVLYIIGVIGSIIFFSIAVSTFFVWDSDNTVDDIFLYVSIATGILGSVSGICVLIAMFLLFGQYNNIADALNYVPGTNMPQMDMYNQPMNNQLVQQPVQQPMAQPQAVNMQPQMDMQTQFQPQAQNVAPMVQMQAQPQVMQPQPEVAVTNQMTQNNQKQDN